MSQQIVEASENAVRIELERVIRAPIADVFEALLEEAGPGFETPDGAPLSLELEPFPGGRWYRKLGEAEGHLWGVVQSIRAPELLELRGPLFMSLPITNNVHYSLDERDGATVLRLVHTAFGPLTDEMREHMPRGWNHHMNRIAAPFAG